MELEAKAEQQLRNTASLPFIYKHLAVMPDCHWGEGSTVGSVLPTMGAIVPAAVGVDIGCGMIAHHLPGVKLDAVYEHRKEIYAAIEAAVPHGRTDNGGKNDKGSWSEPWNFLSTPWSQMKDEFDQIVAKHPRIGKWGDPVRHLGTLGTGNHFIEICGDENDRVWVMLHSGSRGIGNRVGTHFINLAKRECERWYVSLPDASLSFLPEGTEYRDDYVEAVGWAQNYASVNRQIILGLTVEALYRGLCGHFELTQEESETAVNCHHNYVAKEHHFGKNVFITRKGAVRARIGDLGIIPGSMGASSYIVEGLGNRDSFHSCSHGAGRRMSRTQAKKTFTVEDHIKATEGVECRKDKDVIDETPAAYKPIDDVMEAQKDLVAIEHTLRQIVCVKG